MAASHTLRGGSQEHVWRQGIDPMASRTGSSGGSVIVFGVVALFAAAGAVALVELVIRRSDIGAGLVLGHLLFTRTFPISTSFDAGGVRIGSSDLLFVLLLTASIARMLRIQRLTTQQRLLVVIGLLVAWSVVRGAVAFEIPAAVNESRGYLSFIGAAMYFSTIEPRRELFDRIGWLWLITTMALAALTIARWGANAAGVTGGIFEGTESGMRVVGAETAFVMAQGAFIALPLLASRSRGLIRYLGPAVLVLVVLLQHRTVWVITAAGTVYLLYRERAVAKRVLTGIIASLALFAILVFVVFDGPSEDVSAGLARSAQSTGTFEWRVAGWVALLEQAGPEGPGELAAGRPFGTGWYRVLDNGLSVDVSPHNFYVESFLRIGVVGVITLLWIYLLNLRGTLRARSERILEGSLLAPGVLHVMIAVQLLYAIPYDPDVAQALLLGLACAVAGGMPASDPRVRALAEARG